MVEFAVRHQQAREAQRALLDLAEKRGADVTGLRGELEEALAARAGSKPDQPK
jgi:hypothetical protein